MQLQPRRGDLKVAQDAVLGCVQGEISSPGGTQAVFIAEGEVVEQVFDGGNALILQRLRDARADALDELKGCFETQGHNSDAISAGEA